MAKSVKGTQTEQNLLNSFAGESQARMRYTYFASKAKKEGFEQISAIFTETADNEKEHAERFFKFLEGGVLQVTGSYPAGVISTTVENLRAAAAGENEEHTELYPKFAEIADKEGFPEIAECWRRVSVAEKHHEARYLELLDNLENDRVFKKDTEIRWKCRNCGYVYTAKEAYEKCPACLHPKAYMEELADNF
ncbi:MAG: rubrerythrin family protein [Endomicrobium sp.]|jgi:rubrerythrin|nr:rubrerythrin family protein [Endomicrobium sp.]